MALEPPSASNHSLTANVTSLAALNSHALQHGRSPVNSIPSLSDHGAFLAASLEQEVPPQVDMSAATRSQRAVGFDDTVRERPFDKTDPPQLSLMCPLRCKRLLTHLSRSRSLLLSRAKRARPPVPRVRHGMPLTSLPHLVLTMQQTLRQPRHATNCILRGFRMMLGHPAAALACTRIWVMCTQKMILTSS